MTRLLPDVRVVAALPTRKPTTVSNLARCLTQRRTPPSVWFRDVASVSRALDDWAQASYDVVWDASPLASDLLGSRDLGPVIVDRYDLEEEWIRGRIRAEQLWRRPLRLALVVRPAPLDRVQRRSGPPGGVRPGVQRDRPGSPLGGACARGAQRVRAAPGTRRKAVSGRSADAALPGPDDLRAQRGRGRALRGARVPPGPGRPPRRAASHRGPLRRRRRAAGIPHERDGHGLRPAHRGRARARAMS